MYYWISWAIHAALILSVLVFCGLLVRYYRFKPKVSKIPSEAENAEAPEGMADEHDYDAVDPAALYTSRNGRS